MEIDTAQSKFGGASALFNPLGGRLLCDEAVIPSGGDFTIEFWIRIPSTTSNFFYAVSQGNTVSNAVTVGYNGASNIFQLWIGNPTSTSTIAYTNSITKDQWYHVAVVRDGNDYTIFRDGNIDTNATVTDTNGTSIANNTVLGSYATTTTLNPNGHLDEVRISSVARYTSAFTPPTAELQNITGTELLLHMNGADGSTTFTDDDTAVSDPINLSGVFTLTADGGLENFADYFEEGYIADDYFAQNVQGEAVLTAVAALTFDGDIASTDGYYIPDYIDVDYFEGAPPIEGEATLSSAATMTTVNIRVRLYDASLSVSSSTTATPSVTRSTDATLDTVATTTTVAGKTVDASISITGAFTPTITVNARRAGVAALDAITTMTTVNARTRSTDVTLDNIVNLSLQGVRIVPFDSTTLAAATTLTAVGIKSVTVDATLATQTTLTASADRIRTTSSTQAANTTLSNTISKIARTTAQLDAAAGLIFIPGALVLLPVTSLDAQANITAITGTTAAGEATIDVVATLECEGLDLDFADIHMDTRFTLSCAPGIIVERSATFNSVFDLSIDSNSIAEGVATLDAAFTQTTFAGKNVNIVVPTFNTATTLTANTRFLRAEEIVYTIPAENRSFSITAEDRIFTISQETRQLSIESENRQHSIPNEIRLYTVEDDN